MKIKNKKVTFLLAFLVCYIAVFAVFGKIKVPNSDFQAVMNTTDGLPVIVLDAGHGGADGGCSSADGLVEKDINLSILLSLREMLVANGYTVDVTRDTDKSIHDKGVEGLRNQKVSDMKNRLEIINKYDNAVAVSIHQNQFVDSKYSGAQMFFSETNPLSESFAEILQKSFVKNLQPENDRETNLSGKELYLIYYSKCPMVMAECGFLSNEAEAKLLGTKEYQEKVAFTLFCGIVTFINENYSKDKV